MDVLRAADKGARKTRIMYVANLSYRLLEKYLRQTLNVGFLCFDGGNYDLTEKGREFLERYCQFSSKYSELERELENMTFERNALEKMCEPPEDLSGKPVEKRSRARR